MLEFQNKILKLDSGYTDYLIKKYEDLNTKLGLQIKPRLSDFKAIEAAIMKNKAYPEFQTLAAYANKHYPKTILGTYHQAMYYEKTGNFKKALKEYQKAFSQEEIRELTKEFMLNKAEDLKGKEDNPTEEAPTLTPTEAPAEKQE
jgi:hypothetical protein